MVFTKQLRQKKGCQFKMKLSRWLPSVTRISFFRLGMSCLSWLSESSFQNFVCLWNFLDALNYVPLQFPKLCGMTGTAATESTEFESIYKLKVTIVPTNKPMIRKVSSCLSLLCNTLIFFAKWDLYSNSWTGGMCVCARAQLMYKLLYFQDSADGLLPFKVKFRSLNVHLSRFSLYIIKQYL